MDNGFKKPMLGGCVSAPLRVEMPIMASCVREVPARPAYEFDVLAPTSADGEIVLALARDWLRGRGYEAGLEAIIAGCP
jgi:hypothetical protein